MKQTPVEWLVNELRKLSHNKNYHLGMGDIRITQGMLDDLSEQAKVMEKTQSIITEDTSDGYHTFKELYEFRKAYNVALFNEWGTQQVRNPKWASEDNQPVNLPKYDVHKSWRYNDGELCGGGGWFIVVAVLPTGQISNHYQAQDWELFNIPSYEKAKYPFDGHTPKDVMDRLLKLK